MTPERWKQIEDIFHEALDHEGDVRSDLIRRRTAGDEELRSEVEKLLQQFAEASGFIEEPAYDSGKSGFLSSLFGDEDEDPMVGRLLGTYRIEKEVGRGGMGAVYEAFRADGEFRRRVAVKVVKRGVDTDFVLRRFRNERQILAALDHPFITRLIDGGTTDDGRPYFVMDFIDGLPLYRHCDKLRLNVKERLTLFCSICEAVEYAHKKLVIHRDLKPSNIFIASDGTPRLLDFGIAKLLDPDMALDTLQPTATALRMMTVDYASPEQVKGEKVTYATDVYSLGVILYELLTALRPYRLKSRSPHDVARAICDDEPPLPSRAITSDDPKQAPVKVNTGISTIASDKNDLREPSERVADQLRGSLDGIIMKALRKERSQRYASAADLRKDIEKYLRGEDVGVEYSYPSLPVKKIPSDASSKLLAVLPLSLLSPDTGESTDESYLTVGLADAIITRLTSVRKLTVRPTSSVTRYNEHLVNPFRAGMELGVDYVLDGRIRRFGHRLRVSLQLLDVRAGTAMWAGQFDEDLTDVLELEDAISEQVAAALIPQLTGEDREKLAKRGTNVPQAYEAYLRGRFYWNQFTSMSLPRAIEAFQRAIELDPNYALAYVGIADFYIWANIYGIIPVTESYERATAAAKRAIEIDPELGEAFASMGLIVLNNFEYEKAERLFLRSFELSPNYSLAHEWYSALLIGNGRTREGLEEIRRAEDIDPLSLRTKVLVAWSLYQSREFDAALAKSDEIIGLDENYPQGHLQRANVLCELGRAAEAVSAAERCNALMPRLALAENVLCFAYCQAGRRADAKRLLDSMTLRSTTEYVKPWFLGMACLAAGEKDRAFDYFEISLVEHDPWLAWLTTEPKLEPLRSDERFRKMLRACRKTLLTGRGVGMVDTGQDLFTLDRSGYETGSVSEMPTLPYKRGFVRRHIWLLSAAALFILLTVTAYLTGVLSIEVRGPAGDMASATADLRSVAVLPFANDTGDAGSDYISDGLTESLISRLAGTAGIRVMPRSAVFPFKGVESLAAGRQLGVDEVIVGSLSGTEDDIQLKIEAFRTRDGSKRFSMTFVESKQRIFALHDLVSERVLEAYGAPRGQLLQQSSLTDNNEAFQLYLKGEYARQKGTPAAVMESIGFYQQALALDPDYALALQGLAQAYRTAPAYGAITPQETFPKAKSAAERAIAIDPSLSTARVVLAAVRATYDWDFKNAEMDYRQAVASSPNNSEVHFAYGNFLVALGRLDEALVEFRTAHQLDPTSLTIETNIGWGLYIAGQYGAAEDQIRRVLARDPTYARAYLNLGEILQEQGRFDEAITAMQKARELSNDALTDMALGHTYATAGRRDAATKIAEQLEERVRSGQVSPFLPAVVYAGLNEKDRAFYWLERAYQERSNWLTLIKVGRRLKNLRGDPRFDDLLKRVGLPV